MIHMPRFQTGPQSASMSAGRERVLHEPPSPLWNWWHSKTSRHSAYQKSGNASVTGPPRLPHTRENRGKRKRDWMGKERHMEEMNVVRSSTMSKEKFWNNNSNTPAQSALKHAPKREVYLYNSYGLCALLTVKSLKKWVNSIVRVPKLPMEAMLSQGLVIWWAGCVRPGFPRDWNPPGLGFTCDTQGLPVNCCTERRLRTKREERDGWREKQECSNSGEKISELGLNVVDCLRDLMYVPNHTLKIPKQTPVQDH